jgi:hypothetical protein
MEKGLVVKPGFKPEDDRLLQFYYKESLPPITRSLSSVTNNWIASLISRGGLKNNKHMKKGGVTLESRKGWMR